MYIMYVYIYIYTSIGDLSKHRHLSQTPPPTLKPVAASEPGHFIKRLIMLPQLMLYTVPGLYTQKPFPRAVLSGRL